MKQNPQKTNQPSLGVGTSTSGKKITTSTTWKVTLEELEEKQSSWQILTLIDRQILLGHEVKRNKIQGETPSPQPILEQFEKLPFIHSEKSREELEKTFGNQETLLRNLLEWLKKKLPMFQG